MNPGMKMYMMTQGDQSGRMVDGDGKYQERGIGNDEHGYPLPYREPRPEFGETDMRYRGEDGRYKSGTRRNSMGMMDRERKWEFTVRPKEARMGEPMREPREPRSWMNPPRITESYGRRMEEPDNDDDDYDDPSGRVIGFGTPRNHFGNDGEMKSYNMQRGSHSMKWEEFDREQAMEWVEGMENEDKDHPYGPKWDVNFLKPMAQKLGIPAMGPEFWKFYAVTNAMHSDYSKVLSKYGVTSPMCYAELAVAFEHDKDAVDNKTEVYYDCIVRPKRDEEA